MDKSINILDTNRGNDIYAFIDTIIDMVTCPISYQLTKDLYLAPVLRFYEIENTEQWLSKHGSSPVTRHVML